MKKFLFCLLLCVYFVEVVHAEQIILKDGTIFVGYVTNQYFGQDASCDIQFSSFTKTFPLTDMVGSDSSVRMEVSAVDQKWIDWATNNGKLETVGKQQYLTLSTITFSGLSQRQYYILERGTKYIKCHTISDGSVRIKTADIHCIVKEMRQNTLLTDMDDVVKTDKNAYVGVILEQYPGVQLKIWNKKDKQVHVLNYSEIKSIGKEPFNEDYSIWAQTKYLDRITTNNGSTEYGLIIENGLGSGYNMIFASRNEESYTTMQYSYKDIISISRKENEDFRPEYDVLLEDGESRIQRDSTLNYAVIQKYQYVGPFQVYYVAPQDTVGVQHVKNKHVTIETSLEGIKDVYIFAATKREALSASKDKTYLLTYTLEDLFASDIPYDYSISINGTAKLEFDVHFPAYYFVYLRGLDKCWLFKYDEDNIHDSNEVEVSL